MRTLVTLGVLFGLGVPAFAADPPVKVDRYGDPLPSGAIMRLGTLRNRAPIISFGVEKDGTVVTVGPGADVRRWLPTEDKSDEPIPLPLKGPETSNGYPQVSADGKFVAACSNEKLFVWETPADAKAKPKEAAVFEIPRVRLFRFSPDGTKLVVTASANQMSTVRVCGIKTGTMTLMDGGARSIEGANFSGDGKRLVVAAGSEFFLWDATTGKQLAKSRSDGRTSSEFALNTKGDLLVARVYLGPDKIEWRFLDPLTGKTRDGLSGPEGGWWVTFAPDGKNLIIGDQQSVRLWDPVAGKVLQKFDGIASGYYGLQKTPARFSADGKLLVAHNGTVLLRWDVKTGKPLFPEQDLGHGQDVSAIGTSPDGKRIATASFDHRVCVWDAATSKLLWQAHGAGVHSSRIPFSPDGKFVYFGGPKWGEVTKYDAESGKVLLKFATDPKQPRQASVSGVRVSKDGKTVYGVSGAITLNESGLFTAWDAVTGERLKTTRLQQMTGSVGELSPGADLIAFSGFALAELTVVTVAAPNTNLLRANGSFYPGDFSGNGQLFAQSAYENANGAVKYSAVVYSTLNWGAVCTIPLTKLGPMALSPDGKTLAIATSDELEFYDTVTAKRLGGYSAPPGDWAKARAGNIQVLRFSPDGTKLITGHANTTALVWPVPQPAK